MNILLSFKHKKRLYERRKLKKTIHLYLYLFGKLISYTERTTPILILNNKKLQI